MIRFNLKNVFVEKKETLPLFPPVGIFARNPTFFFSSLRVQMNDETYCFCKRAAVGEMIACDNPSVICFSSVFFFKQWC